MLLPTELRRDCSGFPLRIADDFMRIVRVTPPAGFQVLAAGEADDAPFVAAGFAALGRVV